jgi:hypothetical protein
MAVAVGSQGITPTTYAGVQWPEHAELEGAVARVRRVVDAKEKMASFGANSDGALPLNALQSRIAKMDETLSAEEVRASEA